MKTRLLFFLLAISTNFFGQIGFHENIIVGETYTTLYPKLVKAADIDGDNDLDIITYGGELNWYENVDGLGNFGEKKIISNAPSTPNSLDLADYDNDGDLDILGSSDNKLTIYKNTNGLGNFAIMQFFTLGTSYPPLSALAKDMDNDGKIDILCFYSSGGIPTQASIVWYKNNGGGSFGSQQIIYNNADNLIGGTYLFADDLDGDGDQDIILGYGNSSKITWFKNIGNNVFNEPITISTTAGGIKSVFTSDIDNDGDKDIISTQSDDNQIVWYKNLNGLGNFSDELIITSNATATRAAIITDINNDGTKDIVYTNTNEIGWMSNSNGTGDTFTNPQVITNKAYDVQSVIMADLDGDGKKDLVSASYNDDKVAWYKNLNNSGSFGRQVTIARRIKFPRDVFPGDFDGDSDIDLLVNSQHDSKLAWFENVNGLGFYGKQHIITENPQGGGFAPISYPFDADGDGDLDIATIKNSFLFWYENVDGHGNFTTEHIINNYGSANIIRAQDVDNDGDMDLVCGMYSGNRISWYKNLGNGIFSTELIIANSGENPGSLTSLEIADMDGDNDIDIIASAYNTATYYYKNTNGLGNFSLQYMEVFDRLQAVYPADMDGDGDKDIIGVSSNGGSGTESVVWYENSNGLGVFTVQHNISTLPILGKSIHAADIDNDGDIDVLTASDAYSPVTGELAWYENYGNGIFSEKQIIDETFDYTDGLCVSTADIDNDNDLDILATFGYFYNATIGKVSVYKNMGTVGNTIQGRVLIDSDSNGCTTDDLKGSNLLIISDNGANSFATFTDQNGNYHVATTAGVFTTAITSQLPNYFVSTPASYSFNFTGMNNTGTANFCVAPIGTINDLNASLYPSINDLRPGFPTQYRIVYRNVGTTTSNGTINFQYNNNKISFVNATQTVSSQTTNDLTFSFANLKPFETRTIDLNFNVLPPPTTNLNDVVSSNVTIIQISGNDQTEEDNSFALNQTVIGSYDPNDITCLEGNQVMIGDADKYLHYIIRFQNTGTASAINVNVENPLDSKLDWTSMQIESLSHNGRIEIKNGSEVKFIFNNINLPSSAVNEPKSHGFIAYKIKPMNNVVVGDIVNNIADIYFDFNPAIVTNTTSTEFVSTLSVSENEINKFSIYPNPTTNLLNIEGSTTINKVSLFDINGRMLKEFSFDNPILFTQLDLTDLTTGVYFLKIKSNQNNTNIKIFKK